MNSTTVAVDLAKSVFQLTVSDASSKVLETHRLTRSQFERWFMNRDVSLVIIEEADSVNELRMARQDLC
jgi:transposase